MININKIYQWSRTNLFSNWYNSLLSLIIIFAFIKFIPPLLNWLFFDATFKGSSKAECYGDGACWIFIKYGLKNYLWFISRESSLENKSSFPNFNFFCNNLYFC